MRTCVEHTHNLTMRHFLVIGFLICAASQGRGKVFEKCELVRKLYEYGMSQYQLSDWLCLIEAESSRNTKATHKNKNGSVDYGLFQINNKYWCSEGVVPGKDCRVRCQSLLSDDIRASVKCAQLIYKRHGFGAWYGWRNKCKGRKLPDVRGCF